jgi:hypothetical protein
MGSPRRGHRRLAVGFTVVVIANVVNAVVGGPEWVGYLALAPLVGLMVTGWYLLWATSARRRPAQRAA